MKLYQHDDGHMTKMATMPMYGKNPLKMFSGFPGNLVCSMGDSGPSNYVQIMTLCGP